MHLLTAALLALALVTLLETYIVIAGQARLWEADRQLLCTGCAQARAEAERAFDRGQDWLALHVLILVAAWPYLRLRQLAELVHLVPREAHEPCVLARAGAPAGN